MMGNNLLKISLDIFSLNTIQAAISIYARLATIHITSIEDNTAYLQFDSCKYGCDRTQKEFMNYIINLESTKA